MKKRKGIRSLLSVGYSKTKWKRIMIKKNYNGEWKPSLGVFFCFVCLWWRFPKMRRLCCGVWCLGFQNLMCCCLRYRARDSYFVTQDLIPWMVRQSQPNNALFNYEPLETDWWFMNYFRVMTWPGGWVWQSFTTSQTLVTLLNYMNMSMLGWR